MIGVLISCSAARSIRDEIRPRTFPHKGISQLLDPCYFINHKKTVLNYQKPTASQFPLNFFFRQSSEFIAKIRNSPARLGECGEDGKSSSSRGYRILRWGGSTLRGASATSRVTRALAYLLPSRSHYERREEQTQTARARQASGAVTEGSMEKEEPTKRRKTKNKKKTKTKKYGRTSARRDEGRLPSRSDHPRLPHFFTLSNSRAPFSHRLLDACKYPWQREGLPRLSTRTAHHDTFAISVPEARRNFRGVRLSAIPTSESATFQDLREFDE